MSVAEATAEVAQDWKHVKLKDVAEKPQYGLTASAAQTGQVKFLRITDITERGVNWDTVPYCDAEQDKIKACLLQSGDIVFARIGATTGKSYLIQDPPNAVFASYLIRVRTRRELDPEFLSHFFKSEAYWGQVNSNKYASLKQGVNGSILSDLVVPVPPFREQQGIAQVLSTVQQAIEQQERLIRTTTELKQALMQKLFTEGLRGEAQKETEIGLVPESWAVVTLGDLGRVVTGTTPSTQVPEYYAPAEADFIAPADIGNSRQVKDSEKKISLAGYAVTRPLPPDAVLCVCIGATIGKVGMSTKLHSATNQQINSIVCNEEHDPRFIYYFLLHHAGYWRGFATFGTMPMLSKGAFEKIPVYVPVKRDEQSAIADLLVALDNKLEVAGKKCTQLQDLFRTLLHELMTGKVRVGELNMSVAET